MSQGLILAQDCPKSTMKHGFRHWKDCTTTQEENGESVEPTNDFASWMIEALITAGYCRATSTWMKSDGFISWVGQVEDVGQQFSLLATHNVTPSRIQRVRKCTLKHPRIQTLSGLLNLLPCLTYLPSIKFFLQLGKGVLNDIWIAYIYTPQNIYSLVNDSHFIKFWLRQQMKNSTQLQNNYLG